MLIRLLILTFLFSMNCYSQNRGVGKNFFRDITKIENPFGLRDPFKSPLKQKTSKRLTKKGGYVEKNTFVNRARVDYKAIRLNKLRIVGVIVGPNRRALAKHPSYQSSQSDNVFIIKEGEILGPDKAVLKAILPGGVIFVEKIINVYGQEEYLETVIPISR